MQYFLSRLQDKSVLIKADRASSEIEDLRLVFMLIITALPL